LATTCAALLQLLSGSAAPVPTSRNFENLMVDINFAQLLLAFGARYVDANNVVIQHWFNGQAESLELRNGCVRH
jgi:hypothetical protein